MAYQSLYRAWRPERFCDIVGQDGIVKTLVNQIETGRISHAYLFCGSRGTGKTTTAKVLARAINCMHPLPGAEPCGDCEACLALMNENSMDVLEIDAASNNGVDEIRDLRDRIQYPPTVGRYKVYIIDEVHMLSAGAFNALLKTLEEPPSHAVFILATTEPQKLPATILSRCQRYDFHRIRAKVIVDRLRVVLKGIGESADDAALSTIARAAEGGMRDALSLMDMCLSYGSGALTDERVRAVLGSSDPAFLFDFADTLLNCDAARALAAIDGAMSQGRDPQVFMREVTGHFRSLIMARLMSAGELSEVLEIAQEDAARYKEQAKGAAPAALERRMELFMRSESDLKWAAMPRAALELCAVKCCHPEREEGEAALEERLLKLETALASGAVVKAQPKEKKAAAAFEKAAAPAPEKAAKQKGAPPAGEEAYKKALEILKAKDRGLYQPMSAMEFMGYESGVVKLCVPRKWGMYQQILDRAASRAIVEEALSEAFGERTALSFSKEKEAEKAAGRDGAQSLGRAYEAFGRENVVISDK